MFYYTWSKATFMTILQKDRYGVHCSLYENSCIKKHHHAQFPSLPAGKSNIMNYPFICL